MKSNKFKKYAGIVIILLIAIALIPSVLSQAEGTADKEVGPGVGTQATGSSPSGSTAGGVTASRIGVGTIAMGNAITETAVIAIAALQPDSSNNAATIH